MFVFRKISTDKETLWSGPNVQMESIFPCGGADLHDVCHEGTKLASHHSNCLFLRRSHKSRSYVRLVHAQDYKLYKRFIDP